MKSRQFYSLILIFLMILLSLNGVFAQESTETPEGESTEAAAESTSDAGTGMGTGTGGEMASCDSDLILSWYIAERFFGFSSFNGDASSDMMMNFDNIDRGPYLMWFDEIDESAAWSPDDATRSSMMDVMTMSDADFDAQMSGMGDGGMMNMSMMDESEECATLRATLRRFYTALAMSDVNMSNMGNMGTDAGESGSSDGTDSGSDTGSTGEEQAGVITTDVNGAEEVPGPGDEDGSGTATVYLRSEANEVCVDISVSGITLPATAAHIHQAPIGEAGPSVVPLTPPNESGVSSTCAAVDPALMQQMIDDPQNFYVNIHTSDFPEGAVRGQLD